MTVTITLPDNLAGVLQERAAAAHQSLDEYVASVLALDAAQPTDFEGSQEALADTVAQIRALPPRTPSSISRATASLHDLLASGPEVTDFDEAVWNRAWAEVEAEADARDRQGVVTNGRHV